MFNLKLCSFALVSLLISGVCYATKIDQTFTLTADIHANTSSFYVKPLTSWPRSSLVFLWDESSQDFVNPSSTLIKVKSPQNVEVSVSTSMYLNSSKGTIPIKLELSPVSASGKGKKISEVTATPAVFHEIGGTSGILATEEVVYEMKFMAQNTGMFNNSGSSVTKPEPGKYNASIVVVFDNKI
ncbi:TPA: hypothetical protein NJ328_003881 [Vibrio parahaemolyticus]|uniref:hypothetical protein n=1 Tax=Vibrio parahaemolyticus TaxID=670 RepID=UPI0015B9961E|nr:hypothetical protein [Vibrio parahaemolyticus]MDG2632065.1 hypothetical protein [Vibrio parahaemolyticus]QLE29760.1 hypothetical protein FDV78_03830 [Vibrio parahaemolyticus]HCG7114981.1 hypothetical protein [Vibrio parahaemolyticus]